MRPGLAWSPEGSIVSTDVRSSPGRGEVQLSISHTLVDKAAPPGTAVACLGFVEEIGAEAKAARGEFRITGEGEAASCRTLPQSATCPAPTGVEPARALLLPALLQVLGALDTAPALGWSAVVQGDDLRAELLLGMALSAGARCRISLRFKASPDAFAADDTILGMGPENEAGLIEFFKHARGPILAFDTSGESAKIETLLAVLPRNASLFLFHVENHAPTAINFYRDVHRKCINVYGVSDTLLVSAESMRRGLRLLDRELLSPAVYMPVTRQATRGITLPHPSRRWTILQWSDATEQMTK